MTSDRAVTLSSFESLSVKRRPGRVILALQFDGLGGDRHFDAEFLRLVIGAGHQGHSGDAGREAEIIFDARGGRRPGRPIIRQSSTTAESPSEPA